jgi:putative tryptophan/tyrosine transport system substrate-binding protein
MTAYTRRQLVQGAGLAGLGLLAGCGRSPGQAPPPPSAPRIGLLSGGRGGAVPSRDAFLAGLRELGYVEGQDIVIEYRSVAAQADQYDAVAFAFAVELVHLPVDVLVVVGARPTQAAKSATSTTPIVIAFTSEDPVAAGLVASLAQPGGNVTGLSAISPQLSGKRLELVKETVGGGAPIAVLWNAANPAPRARFEETQAAAQVLGVPVQSLAVREASDLDSAFEAAVRERAVALIALRDSLTLSSQAQLVELAAKHRLPAMYEDRVWTDAGGLMAYGPSIPDMSRRAATYVDRILKGANPADLPVEQPMRFDFVINARTAQTLGLTIPPHVLLQATEVIQ